jgi:gluconate 2-dehydrogenase gamma chain
MANDKWEPTRRSFMDKAVVAAVGIAATSRLPKAAGAIAPYRTLNASEAAFTEAMVNAFCPADRLTPNGVDCGLAASIDRQLAGVALTQQQFFKGGIAAMNAACEERFACRFDQLAPAEASAYLREVAAAWLNQIVDPLLIQASFAGPVYDRYGNRVFWKLFGHTEIS